ncbi:MAG: alpha/beta hydrolase [Bryobacterales bacterium]|nr:alpha/beta hydrolase [Bryobacterales bacterium]
MTLTRRSFLASCPLALAAQDPVPPIRGLSRTNLLEYRTAGGGIRVARRRGEWAARRNEAIAGMVRITGPLPGASKRCPLDVAVEDEADMGTYVRRLIAYSSEPGSRTTAYLCLPKEALAGRKTHGVLCLHPTENKIGHKVVVGLGGLPNRQYASELAERGYVTIAPSYPQLAAYQPDLRALGYRSGTMKAIWDNVRALDLLDGLPYVRKGRYAAIGHSLGGHNAIYTACFEPRIRVIVSSCGFDSFLDYYQGNIKGWIQERYMPELAGYLERVADIPFDFYELAACLAPRPFFVNAPLRDSNFRWESVDRIVRAAEPVYALHGALGKIRVEHPDSPHDFPEPVRSQSYDWIAAGLA